MVSERPARSRKSAPGALEAEIDDFERNLIRKSMLSERPARSRKSAPGALEPESNDFGKELDKGIDGFGEACQI